MLNEENIELNEYEEVTIETETVEETEISPVEVVEITPCEAPIVETIEVEPMPNEDPDNGVMPIGEESGSNVCPDDFILYGDIIPMGINED